MALMVTLAVLAVGTLIILHLTFQFSRVYRTVTKQFKGPRTWPLFGNGLEFMFVTATSLYSKVQSLCDENERFTRIWIGPTPYILMYKPEDVEALLSGQTEITKSDDYTLLYDWIGRGLLTSTGSKWRHRRKIITPAFHFNILEDFLFIINQNGNILIEKLSEMAGKGTFNIYDIIKLYTLDNISETALGVKVNAQKDAESEYIRAVKEISWLVTERAFRMWLQSDFLFHLSSYGRRYRKALKVLHNTTETIIRERKEMLRMEKHTATKVTNEEVPDDFGQKKRAAFLDLLLQSEELTDADIREEVDTFMFEGHDTVTSGISFALYCLAHNQNVQEKVYREQIEIFGNSDRDPTSRDLTGMKYLEMVIKESQRLYPSVPLYGRTIENDLKLSDGYFLPKGCHTYVNAAKMHRDPKIWPNPDEFNPDNFLVEAVRNRNPYAFVPFSAGLRNCIGQKFAMMEMKACLGKAVRQFKFHPSKDASDNPQVTSALVLISINGINLEIERR